MKLSAPVSTSPIPSTWPTIAHQTVAKNAARAHLVPRQDISAEYCRNYCPSSPNGRGPTKAGQISIWVFGGLIIIALGVAIGYLWRKRREKSMFNRKETERREARQQVRDRDATVATLQATKTKLENDIQKGQKGKGRETASSSSHVISNHAGPLDAIPVEDRRKRKVRNNGIITDPASHSTAMELFPVKPAPKDGTLASGALQAGSDPLPDDSSPRGIAFSSGHAPEGPSTVDPEPQKPANERLDGVALKFQPQRPEGAGPKPISASRHSSKQARRLSTLERHVSAHRNITGSSHEQQRG